MKYDLHIHSTVSDGKLNKEEIISLAKEKKLEVISFCDHNSFSSVQADNIKTINGIEFDARYKNTSFHSLFYFENYNNNIEQIIEKYNNNINNTSELLISKINEVYNLNLSIDQISTFCNTNIVSNRKSKIMLLLLF